MDKLRRDTDSSDVTDVSPIPIALSEQSRSVRPRSVRPGPWIRTLPEASFRRPARLSRYWEVAPGPWTDPEAGPSAASVEPPPSRYAVPSGRAVPSESGDTGRVPDRVQPGPWPMRQPEQDVPRTVECARCGNVVLYETACSYCGPWDQWEYSWNAEYQAEEEGSSNEPCQTTGDSAAYFGPIPTASGVHYEPDIAANVIAGHHRDPSEDPNPRRIKYARTTSSESGQSESSGGAQRKASLTSTLAALAYQQWDAGWRRADSIPGSEAATEQSPPGNYKPESESPPGDYQPESESPPMGEEQMRYDYPAIIAAAGGPPQLDQAGLFPETDDSELYRPPVVRREGSPLLERDSDEGRSTQEDESMSELEALQLTSESSATREPHWGLYLSCSSSSPEIPVSQNTSVQRRQAIIRQMAEAPLVGDEEEEARRRIATRALMETYEFRTPGQHQRDSDSETEPVEILEPKRVRMLSMDYRMLPNPPATQSGDTRPDTAASGIRAGTAASGI
jgi:ribosomal protein L32